jgi:TorA maturation chaperone TorD
MDFNLERSLIVRAVMYRFLALGFHEPGDALLAFLHSEDEFLKLKEAAKVLELKRADKPVSVLLDQMLAGVQVADWPLRELRVEYNRLFLGPTPPLAPPYESVYDQDRSKEDIGTVQGPSAFSMEAALAEENLDLDLGRVDLYDHVAIELEFMYFLLGKAVKNEDGRNQENIDRADTFLKDRLAKWVPEFGEKVVSKTDHLLYQNLGRLLTEFVRLDVGQK